MKISSGRAKRGKLCTWLFRISRNEMSESTKEIQVAGSGMEVFT